MVIWFAIVLLVMAAQVIYRYLLSAPLTWSEEFSRYSFVWISYLGCAYCVGVDGHTNITALLNRLPEKAQKVLICVGNIIVMGVFIRVFPIALNFIARNGRFPTSMMRIPFKYLYYALIVGIILTVLQLALKSILLFGKHGDRKEAAQ